MRHVEFMMTWSPLNSMRKINQGQWGKVLWQMPPGAGSHYYTYTLFLSPAWCVIPCCCLWDQWLTELIQQLYCQLWPLPDLDHSNPWDPWYYFLVQTTKLYEILDNKRFHGVAEPPRYFKFDHGVHSDSHSEPDRLRPMTCFTNGTWKCLFSVWWYLL